MTEDPLLKTVYDRVLNETMSVKSFHVLRLCPVDVFFTATSTGLHGKTLRGLAYKGYLNIDQTRDGLGVEYYVNNHGHRLRRLSVSDLQK